MVEKNQSLVIISEQLSAEMQLRERVDKRRGELDEVVRTLQKRVNSLKVNLSTCEDELKMSVASLGAARKEYEKANIKLESQRGELAAKLADTTYKAEF